MIHVLKIENFYSVADEVVLDLRAGGGAPDHPGLRSSWSASNVRLPAVVALVGPNASGKSTILRALMSTITFAIRSVDLNPDELISYFRAHASQDWIHKPIKISVDFDANWLNVVDSNDESPSSQKIVGDLFRYELELNTDPGSGVAISVKREAISYNPKGRFRRIFKREEGAAYYLGKEMKMRVDDPRFLAVKANASAISTLAKLNHPLMKRAWTDLKNLQSNAWYYLRAQPNTASIIDHYRNFPELLKAMNRELRRIDVGIRRAKIVESPGIPPYLLFEHDGLSQSVQLLEESAGTRHFVHMFPVFYYLLQTGHVGVFDEFDADLHPVLVSELLGWFRSKDRNPYGAQIFVALHNTSVLEQLEKEEVFLAEKSKDGATKVFGAQDVLGLRRDVSLEKKYKSGTLGALPNIG